MIILVPILAGNLVLGSSLFLLENRFSRNRRVTDRLTVYISLFVFIPGFMYLISAQTQLKWLFSIPETLLAALLSSTAIFLALTSVSAYTDNQKSLDRQAVIFTILITCAFLFVDPVLYVWNRAEIDPNFNLTLTNFVNVSSSFMDTRILPWMVLIAVSYLVPYARVYNNFRSSRLSILLVAVFVLYLTSFKFFRDPAVFFVAWGYVLFSYGEIRSGVAYAAHWVIQRWRRSMKT